MAVNVPIDIRELVEQKKSIPAFHKGFRLRPDQLTALYKVNEELVEPLPTAILVVDDLLTTGCHFKAMKTVLLKRFPKALVGGLFIARRVFADTVENDECLSDT